MAKKKFSHLVSPRGKFKFTYVTKPDDKFTGKDEDPDYKTLVLIEDNDANRKWCEEVFEQGKAEAKKNGVKLKKAAKSPFVMPEDIDEDDFVPEEGKENPKFDEDFREAIHFPVKTKFKPGLIDSAKNELPSDVRIFGGDEGKVKFELNPYEGFGSGLSLRLKVVQLIEKNTSFSAGVNTDGFDEEEDGYVAPDVDDEDDDEEDF